MREGARRGRRPTVVPRPERVRTIHGTAFGWVAAAIQRDGWLRVLTPDAVAAYTFLCLAADRHGVSFYRRGRISQELGLDDQALHGALTRLEELDLVAYAPFSPGAPDGYRQVLSLPSGGPPCLLPPELIEALRRRGVAE